MRVAIPDAEVVLSALKDVSRLGTTVVTVIHQPRYSVYKEFTHLLLLGAGGRQVRPLPPPGQN